MQLSSLRLQHHDNMTYLYYRVTKDTKADSVILSKKSQYGIKSKIRI